MVNGMSEEVYVEFRTMVWLIENSPPITMPISGPHNLNTKPRPRKAVISPSVAISAL